MILLINKYNIFKQFLYYLNLKYNNSNLNLYLKGFFGFINFYFLKNKNLYLNNIKNILFNIFFELTNGYLEYLILNGLGFKATRKMLILKEKYWRFNIGHSHVFQYFTPKNIILKVKNRNIFIFGFKKNQILDITQFLQKFHKPDIYKGIGIKYPYEIFKLKKGKVRQ